MSMAEAFASASTELSAEPAEASAPADAVGEEAAPEAPAEDTPTESSDTPETPEFDGPPRLDLDEFGDYLVPIVVDGEETWVPLSETRKGYMRQADYTRKTQGAAQDRQSIEWANTVLAALEQDPQSTIQALAQRYGVVEQAPQMPEFDDPLQAEVWQLRQELQSQINELHGFYGNQLVEQELQRCRADHADFDEYAGEVLQTAANLKVPLETAYKIVTWNEQATKAADAERRAQIQAAVREQKRKSQVVSSGGVSAGKPPMSDEPEDNSFAATLRWAQRQMS